MQGSHREATLRASATNSLVFLSSTPLAVAARPRSLKLFMTSGVLDLNVEMPVETDCVSSRKLLVRSDMAYSLDTYGLCWRSSGGCGFDGAQQACRHQRCTSCLLYTSPSP